MPDDINSIRPWGI